MSLRGYPGSECFIAGVTPAVAGWVLGEMVSRVEIWGCLYMGKNERREEASSLCPGCVRGTSITGASCRKKSWEQTPFHVGCAGRMPRKGAL